MEHGKWWTRDTKRLHREPTSRSRAVPTKPTLFLSCNHRASSLPAPGTNTAGNGTTAWLSGKINGIATARARAAAPSILSWSFSERALPKPLNFLLPVKQSNLGKTVTDSKLSDRPAERTSLQERLAAMKARVSGTPAGRDAVDKTKGKEMHELISVSLA